MTLSIKAFIKKKYLFFHALKVYSGKIQTYLKMSSNKKKLLLTLDSSLKGVQFFVLPLHLTNCINKLQQGLNKDYGNTELVSNTKVLVLI